MHDAYNRDLPTDETSSGRHRLIAAALATGTFILYATRLEHTPAYLYNAEILFGLQAQAIATTGHDLYGRLLPVYFQMKPLGEGTWFHPALVYTSAMFLRVLPFAEWSVRVPSAAVGALNVALVYALGTRIFSRRRDAVLAAVLLALTPAHFIHSRIAMDYIYPLPFALGWLLMLSHFLEKRRTWMIFAATSILGLGVYSYIASVIMMPLYLAMTLVVLWSAGALSARSIVAAVAGFAWPLVAIPVWLWTHSPVVAQTLSRYQIGTTPNRYAGLFGRVSMFWYFFDPAYLFLSGGYANVVNSTRHTAVFALPLAVLIPVGAYRILSGRRTAMHALMLAGFITAPVAACLAVPEPYAIDRELTVVPFGVLVASYALASWWESRTLWRRLAMMALALVPLQFAFFYVDYFTDYRRHSGIWFELNHRGACEAVLARESTSRAAGIYLPLDKDPDMESYWRFSLTKAGRLDLLAKTALYSDADFDPQALAPTSLVVARRSEPTFARLNAAHLRLIATIPEVGDPPEFVVFER